ncbi:MAG TPA: heavy metal-associated domain-containing protein [Bacteroidia bacterium]|nr:heavy metal-associated domain-containing protein [Bacteroidia bacterium]
MNAQTDTSAKVSGNSSIVKIKTSAECDMCKKRIEQEVSKMKGVKKATLDLDTKILTVEYNPKKTSPDKIRKAISDIGYDADDVKANNRASHELQHCTPKQDSAH